MERHSTADGLGHAVTAGYIDRNTAGDVIGNTDWVIVHDNWQTTGRNVIVPFVYANWSANTEAIPEPPTFALMALGLGALLVWRRKRFLA